MAERSIAEIVQGWTWRRCDPLNGHENTCGTWTNTAGEWEYGWEGSPPDHDVSVDGMLAWLRGRVHDWSIFPAGPGYRMLILTDERCEDVPDQRKGHRFEASSVLAAVAAAVRQVAEQEAP